MWIFAVLALTAAAQQPATTEVCGKVTAFIVGPNRCDLTLRVSTEDGRSIAAIVPHTSRREFTAALHDYFGQEACVTGILDTSRGEPAFIAVTRPEQLRFRGAPPPSFASGAAEGCVDEIQPPRILREVRPRYAERAMRQRIEGVVVMQAIVGIDGAVSAARVVRSLHPDLDAQALEAIRKWEFKPGMLGPKTVPVLVDVEMSFMLTDRR